MKKIAIFASGSGTNAQKITEYFTASDAAKVEIILSNKIDAFVLQRAKDLGISSHVFDRNEFYQTEKILLMMLDLKIDLIVLAGFLWLIPANLLKQFPNHIINIHPALLPKYGGKGMYGDAVHQAVIANKEKMSGITIHYINEHYDEGNVIFQKSCEITSSDTAKTLAQKVHALEYEFYPIIIENVLNNLK